MAQVLGIKFVDDVPVPVPDDTSSSGSSSEASSSPVGEASVISGKGRNAVTPRKRTSSKGGKIVEDTETGDISDNKGDHNVNGCVNELKGKATTTTRNGDYEEDENVLNELGSPLTRSQSRRRSGRGEGMKTK